MANKVNPLIGTDDYETAQNVANVLEYVAWQRQEGEETEELADGRRLVLRACARALRR